MQARIAFHSNFIYFHFFILQKQFFFRHLGGNAHGGHFVVDGEDALVGGAGEEVQGQGRDLELLLGRAGGVLRIGGRYRVITIK